MEILDYVGVNVQSCLKLKEQRFKIVLLIFIPKTFISRIIQEIIDFKQ